MNHLEKDALDEMKRWLGTMSKRTELRENPEAIALEMSLIEEALHLSGARTPARIEAVFRHIKSHEGLTYWPNAPQISASARALAQGGSGGLKGETGDRSRLSFPEMEKLDECIERCKRWLSVPGLRQHAESFLTFWGEPYER